MWSFVNIATKDKSNIKDISISKRFLYLYLLCIEYIHCICMFEQWGHLDTFVIVLPNPNKVEASRKAWSSNKDIDTIHI